MQELLDATDLPTVVVLDRRHQPDRRSWWRGGRRNADWMSRPIGAWRHLEARLSPWRQWISKFPLHGSALQRQARQ